jgi:adenylate cyclase
VLLLNVLPREIAAELKREGRVEPHHYDHATVLFTDFVGFTRIAESLTPAQLIARLDEAFQEFDRIVQTHRLEKIKTIGDAYLAVGGIPRENSTHALDCALAALELVRATERLRQRHEAAGEPAWSLRVGLHSGPLVAGVIGTEKFAYDVWGDTVNTASRLESSGIPGQINLSAATQQELAEFFECESRGRIEAKGKGELEMFLLRGLRPEFVEADGTPNARFWERLRSRGRGNF